mmetsp:Transcript_12180/g.47150  ORF Transcript_12180/g.47150 Transcript_12180/m.47150 type:complete len:245 (-) Transcript_12180:8-742(-)
MRVRERRCRPPSGEGRAGSELGVGLEPLEAELGVRLHACRAGLPASGAHLAVLVGVLECLDEAERLLDRASDRQVVDGGLAKDALAVDDEQAAQGQAGVSAVLDEHPVVARHLLRDVAHQGDAHAAQASLVARLERPAVVRELGVHADSDHLRAGLAELVHCVREGRELRGAHEAEVGRVEEDDEVLVAELLELDSLEGAVDHSLGFKAWCRVLDARRSVRSHRGQGRRGREKHSTASEHGTHP